MLIGAGALVLVAIAAAVIFGVVLRAPETASGPISAVPLEVATAAPAAAQASAATAAPAVADAPTSTTGSAATAAPAATGAASAASSGDLVRFQIVPEESEARFQLTEELRGEPKTVIGTTNQVAGELAITPNDLATTQIGTIQINARTLTTDSSQRNRAIANFILNTNSFEYISFAPTSITGLSGSGATGQPYTFEIAGNLTIRDVTKPVVFKATATAESEQKVTGNASTVIKRADYNLTIPNVPFVANVSEDVTLELDFVAAPVQ